PLTRDLADALLTGGGSLWNLYGPTEATIWVSAARVGVGAAPMTIGEPIANTHLHVLDAHDQLCPMGVTGQLCIGGLCLADGYFARPDLTTQAFASIVLAGAAPTRLYRTGDLARRLADGSLEVLGRRDHQVKLHGFRLELEEVEHALRRIPGVRSAAAALKTSDSGEARLTGYVVLEQGKNLDPDALREALAATLPYYMVPTAWAQLEGLPQTGNGKLDRKALPTVQTVLSVLGSPTAATSRSIEPRNTTEAELHRIWSEVLEVGVFGVEDKLFSLGADSLLIFRLVARMKESGFTLTARDLMRNPTIAQLAAPRALPKPPAPTVPSLDSYRRNRELGSGRT
ncbi:MAG: hypothetical protein RL701_5622, partial [Pseudomonadota bacterium]